MNRIWKLLAAAVLLGGLAFAADPAQITEAELVRRTQALMDAIASGDPAPWQQYLADDCLFTDELGNTQDKAAFLKGLHPLPKGYSGTIKVVRPQSRFAPNVAILTYDMDESETVFGAQLHARYHATDTWLYRRGSWQMAASQVLRYYEDPAVGDVDPATFDNYVGTYELAPDVTMTVTRRGDALFAQRSGRKEEQLFPEAPGVFFRKGAEGRRIFHTTKDGTVDRLIDRRNNEDLIWKKIK